MTIENITSKLLDLLLSAKDIDLQNFKHGFFAGVIIFAILAVILRLLIFFLFSKGEKKSKGIKISNENGSIIISSGAISDLVKAVGNSTKHVEVSKVKLLESEDKSLYLEVHMIMGGTDTKFGDLSNELQQRIINTIKDRFSADCVKSVSVHLDKIIDSKPS